MLCLLAPQRDRISEHPEFQRIATDGGASQLNLSALDQAQYHKTLHHRIVIINLLNNVLTAALQR